MLITRASGFTLLEILVVLFIVSILSGLVVVNLPNSLGQSETEDSVRRLHVVMNRALASAERESVEYGVLLDQRGYQILAYDPLMLDWQVSPIQEHGYTEFPSSFKPFLAMESSDETKLGGLQDADDGQETDHQPQILLLSSGETSIFELIFDDASGASFKISGSGFGETSLHVASKSN